MNYKLFYKCQSKSEAFNTGDFEWNIKDFEDLGEVKKFVLGFLLYDSELDRVVASRDFDNDKFNEVYYGMVKDEK